MCKIKNIAKRIYILNLYHWHLSINLATMNLCWTINFHHVFIPLLKVSNIPYFIMEYSACHRNRIISKIPPSKISTGEHAFNYFTTTMNPQDKIISFLIDIVFSYHTLVLIFCWSTFCINYCLNLVRHWFNQLLHQTKSDFQPCLF